jgi:hypothetical protein
MKAFVFRLDQALRWRETQLDVQKSRVSAAVGRLAQIEASLEAKKAALSGGAAQIAEQATGATLTSFAGFKEKSLASIRDCEAQALAARRALALEMNRLVEARQKKELLESLKRKSQAGWRREFDRELAAFADEAFLGRIQSENRRARSSGG